MPDMKDEKFGLHWLHSYAALLIDCKYNELLLFQA